MLSQQIRTCNVRDDRIINIMRNLPREHFVPEDYRSAAFSDIPIPIGHDQVMMTPLDEARLLQAIKVQPFETVLEIGTGTGYLTALLAKLAKHVVSLDLFPEFTDRATHKLETIRCHNFSARTQDAHDACDMDARFDVIVITAGTHTLPKKWQKLLNNNGRIFAISGAAPAMRATLMTITDNEHHMEFLFETNIPPLLCADDESTFLF